MEEINKILERIESDLRTDGYYDGNVVIQDLKKVRELALNIGVVSNRFDSKYTPPFRVGRKQGKAVLDANGIDVVFFSNSEEQARKYCDYLNGYQRIIV
tara:strand:+ start:14748 stop:15044 length:297 start_codon:yes stop_codon:yes gene_type:complete